MNGMFGKSSHGWREKRLFGNYSNKDYLWQMKKKPVVALTNEAGKILEEYCVKNEKVKKQVVSKLILKELK